MRRNTIRDLEFGECVQLEICVVGLSHPSSPLYVEQGVYDFFLVFGHLVEQAGATQSAILNSANAFNLRFEWSGSHIHRLPAMLSNLWSTFVPSTSRLGGKLL